MCLVGFERVCGCRESCEWGVKEDSAAGRRQLEQGMEQRKELEMSKEGEDGKRLRRGWWGGEGFPGGDAGNDRGEARGAALRRGIEGIGRTKGGAVGGGDVGAGRMEEELCGRCKDDKKKAGIGLRLRKETTVSWVWIAIWLQMGHWRTATNAVRKCAKT
jgi:hypothetical protein